MGIQQSRIYLNDVTFLHHYFLCNYIPLNTGADQLSRSLIRFKKALEDDLPAWIDCAVNELKKLPLPKNLIILRALSSSETFTNTNDETPLDKLGKSISKSIHAKWIPDLIEKKCPTRPLKLLNAKDRKKELENAYTLNNKMKDLQPNKFLIIDDIVTSGATILAISNLLDIHFSGTETLVFTLAKTTHEYYLNSSINLHGNSYNWQHDHADWMVADVEENYLSYNQLINFISNDNWHGRI